MGKGGGIAAAAEEEDVAEVVCTGTGAAAAGWADLACRISKRVMRFKYERTRCLTSLQEVRQPKKRTENSGDKERIESAIA